jgi:hypothetical protein
MRKNLFLFLVLLVLAGRAPADGIGANCETSGGPPSLQTDGQFQAIACNVAGFGGVVLIDGPAGLETFRFGGTYVDGFRSFYLNDRGEIVLSWQSFGTDSTFVAAYTRPGLQDVGNSCDQCGPMVLPGSTIESNFAFLTLALGPVFHDIPGYPNIVDMPTYDEISTNILATGITDNGIVEGVETYARYDFHAPVAVSATWVFEPTPEPSTWLYALAAVLVTLVIKRNTLFH